MPAQSGSKLSRACICMSLNAKMDQDLLPCSSTPGIVQDNKCGFFFQSEGGGASIIRPVRSTLSSIFQYSSTSNIFARSSGQLCSLFIVAKFFYWQRSRRRWEYLCWSRGEDWCWGATWVPWTCWETPKRSYMEEMVAYRINYVLKIHTIIDLPEVVPCSNIFVSAWNRDR